MIRKEKEASRQTMAEGLKNRRRLGDTGAAESKLLVCSFIYVEAEATLLSTELGLVAALWGPGCQAVSCRV